MKFNDRVEYKKAILIYKSLHEENSPCYMKEKFHFVSTLHNRNLRSTNNLNLHVPKPNLEFYRKSLSYSGTKIWNNIPLYVRQSESTEKFKKACGSTLVKPVP